MSRASTSPFWKNSESGASRNGGKPREIALKRFHSGNEPERSRPNERSAQCTHGHWLVDDGAGRHADLATSLVDAIEIMGRPRHQNPLAVRKSGRSGKVEIHSVPVGKVHVTDDDIGRRGILDGSLDKGTTLAEGPAIHDLVAAALKILANLASKIRVVLDQKYTHTHPDASSNLPVSR